MTTRTPPTAADLAGTSKRGKAAYAGRMGDLRRLGIPVPDEEPGDAALRRDDPEAYQAMMADRREVIRLEADLDRSAADPDDGWMWPSGRRPH